MLAKKIVRKLGYKEDQKVYDGIMQKENYLFVLVSNWLSIDSEENIIEYFDEILHMADLTIIEED